MSRSSSSVVPRHSRLLVATLAAAAIGTAAMPGTPAASAAGVVSPGDASCPAAYPVGDLTPGAAVHGLTVSRGTAPDEFTGEVVGVIPDGIGLGLDMVMVKLSGSVITDEFGKVDRGIWAGMSGSPVYAEDGRLIGAVSYGLSWSPSEYAGVTPAAAMYDLGRYEGLTLPGTATVDTPRTAVAALRRSGLSGTEAEAGFSRLPMPTSVSGLSQKRLRQVSSRLGMAGKHLTTGGVAQLDAPPVPIMPGGNVAMASSYGDVTAGAIGTTTAVCGSSVLAFGHPFNFAGRTTASLHGAEAVYVQRDDVFGSFKVATPTAPVGTFTQDRMAGVLGRLGGLPSTTPVTSHVTSNEGTERTGATQIVDASQAPELATMHFLANLDSVFSGYGPGTGTASWTITVRRPDGELATMTRSDIYASRWDVSGSMPWDFYSQLSRILENPFESVELVSVEQDADLSTQFRQLQVSTVQVRRDGAWVTPSRRSTVSASGGRVLRVRALLVPARGSDVAQRWRYFAIQLPSSDRGRGVVVVHGQRWDRRAAADSLPAMLEQMENAPTNDLLMAELRMRTEDGPKRVQLTAANEAPVVGSTSLRITLR